MKKIIFILSLFLGMKQIGMAQSQPCKDVNIYDSTANAMGPFDRLFQIMFDQAKAKGIKKVIFTHDEIVRIIAENINRTLGPEDQLFFKQLSEMLTQLSVDFLPGNKIHLKIDVKPSDQSKLPIILANTIEASGTYVSASQGDSTSVLAAIQASGLTTREMALVYDFGQSPVDVKSFAEQQLQSGPGYPFINLKFSNPQMVQVRNPDDQEMKIGVEEIHSFGVPKKDRCFAALTMKLQLPKMAKLLGHRSERGFVSSEPISAQKDLPEISDRMIMAQQGVVKNASEKSGLKSTNFGSELK